MLGQCLKRFVFILSYWKMKVILSYTLSLSVSIICQLELVHLWDIGELTSERSWWVNVNNLYVYCITYFQHPGWSPEWSPYLQNLKISQTIKSEDLVIIIERGDWYRLVLAVQKLNSLVGYRDTCDQFESVLWCGQTINIISVTRIKVYKNDMAVETRISRYR